MATIVTLMKECHWLEKKHRYHFDLQCEQGQKVSLLNLYSSRHGFHQAVFFFVYSFS